MNANRYRLIFDKRTGMLIPVAEFTPAASKGNSRGIGDGMGVTSVPRLSRLFATMAMAAGGLGTTWSLHAQMVPDGTTQTTISQTINGTDMVNIANPNASGFDINAELKDEAFFPEEVEIAVPGIVDRRMIVGAYEVDSQGIVPGTFYANPSFELPEEAAAAQAARKSELKVLAERNKQLGKALDLAKQGKKKDKTLIAQLDKELAEVSAKITNVMRDMDAAARLDSNRRDIIR